MSAKQITDGTTTVVFDELLTPGYPNPLAEAVEVYARAGIDGHESSGQGTRAEPFTWICRKWSSSVANANTHCADVAGFQGASCSITDDHNVTTANVLVERVISMHVPKAVIQAGSVVYQTEHQISMRRIA